MKPAVFIIPGSFAPSTYYVPLRERVQGLGYDSYILPLQTIGLRPSPAPTMYDDAAFISTEVKKLVDKEHEVILLGHSYGGVPMSQSTKGLTVSERANAGLKGGIKRLIYTAAFAPPLGENLVYQTGGLPPAFQQYVDDKASYFPRNLALASANATFSDIPPADVQQAAQFFQEQAAAGYIDDLTWAGYSNVSTTYIHTLDDHLLAPATQSDTIQTLKSHSPSFDLRAIHAGHFVMYTQLDEFMDLLGEVLAAEA